MLVGLALTFTFFTVIFVMGMFSAIVLKLINLFGESIGVDTSKSSPFLFANKSTKLAKELEEVFFRLDACYDRIAKIEEVVIRPMPDERPINESEESFSDEIYGDVPESNINPELLEKNRLHDEKIERLKKELEAYRAGIVYNVPHDEIDRRIQPKPEHEYTE